MNYNAITMTVRLIFHYMKENRSIAARKAIRVPNPSAAPIAEITLCWQLDVLDVFDTKQDALAYLNNNGWTS